MRTTDHQLDDFFGLKPEEGTTPHRKEGLRESLVRRLSLSTWVRLLPKVLSVRERYIIFGLAILAIGTIIAIPFTTYYHYTVEQPAYGGSFSEGIVGEPRFINPLLAQPNDADRDLTALVFSGLMEYNAEGKLVPNLAKSYEVSSDGLTYTVYLRTDVLWHDGKPLTADDVLFTIQTAQNPDYASPQRVTWEGVQVSKANDTTILFKLPYKYAQFLNTLTLGILPEHLFKNVTPSNFTLSELNLKPIGTGPYVFEKFRKDKLGRIISYELAANDHFYTGRPYIDGITFKFYASEDEMLDAYNRNQVQSVAYISAGNLKKLRFQGRLNVRQVKLPRYYALFMNQTQSKALADKNVRLALNYGTDRATILTTTLGTNGILANSPMLGTILDINPAVKTYEFDQEKAKEVLSTAGWVVGDDGIRTKNKERLAVRITTSTWPELAQVAGIIREQWKALGVDVTVDTLPIVQLQQAIKDRAYQILLFGEILSVDPDPFILWHSSQKRDPGLNLALYDNASADTLLEEARQTLNPLERAKKYDDFQKIVIEDMPAIFLYSPSYLYGQARSIKGFSTQIISMPSDRFSDVEHWYIDTQRSFKD